MKIGIIALLLLALVALAAAAPAPGRDDDDYDYDNYDYDSYDDDDEEYEKYLERQRNRLPITMFNDLRPRPVQRGSQQPSACSWAVVHCCSNPDRLGTRAGCFARLGCGGAWFSDICTPTIQKNIFKGVLNSLRGH